MEWLVYLGAGLTSLGLLVLLWCIWLAISAKRQGLSDHQMRARMQRIVTINMAALLLSVIGLMTLVMGVFLA